MGRKLKLYLKMVEDHNKEYDRNEHRRVSKALWQARRRLERPQEAKEQARRDWYVRSCLQAGIEPVTPSNPT